MVSNPERWIVDTLQGVPGGLTIDEGPEWRDENGSYVTQVTLGQTVDILTVESHLKRAYYTSRVWYHETDAAARKFRVHVTVAKHLLDEEDEDEDDN